MNKVILLILTGLMMVGCSPEDATQIDDVYDSLTVDSCEYIICAGNLRTHKGNCRFCQERDSIKWEKCKKELEELVIKLKEKQL